MLAISIVKLCRPGEGGLGKLPRTIGRCITDRSVNGFLAMRHHLLWIEYFWTSV